jgi:hypothetical protein
MLHFGWMAGRKVLDSSIRLPAGIPAAIFDKNNPEGDVT